MKVDPSEKTPSATALDWFALQRTGEMTDAEANAFDAWLAHDPEHSAVYRKVERTWALTGDLQDHPVLLSVQDEVDNAVKALSRRYALAAVAAGCVLAAGLGLAMTNAGVLHGLGLFKTPPTQEFRTSVGQRTTVTLLDGSIVTLDTDTVLHARLSDWERRIELDRGQASFQVAKDKSRPFIVAASGKTVRATGTAFDVRVEPGRFEVTLIEGRVRVQEQGAKRGDAPSADMRQGWRLAVGEDARWRMEPVDLVKETSWHDGMLWFHDDTLESAAAEMNRYSHRKIVFSGDPPKRVLLGMFRAGDVDGFVEAVETNKLARVVSRSENRIELAAR